jgi:hypothetical protein
MIDLRDAIELAPGVEVRHSALVDPVRGTAIPLNHSAEIVLAARSIDAAAAALEAAGASDGAGDALAFCTELNTRALINVRIPFAERVRRRAAGLRYGLVLHAPLRRVHVPGSLAVARAVAPLGMLLTLALLPATLLAGAIAFAAAFASGAGIVVHEVAHALALRGTAYALVIDGLRPALLHERVTGARAIAAAAAGPVAPALIAVVLALAWRPIAPAVAPLAAHALALSVLSEDGRNACGLT